MTTMSWNRTWIWASLLLAVYLLAAQRAFGTDTPVDASDAPDIENTNDTPFEYLCVSETRHECPDSINPYSTEPDCMEFGCCWNDSTTPNCFHTVRVDIIPLMTTKSTTVRITTTETPTTAQETTTEATTTTPKPTTTLDPTTTTPEPTSTTMELTTTTPKPTTTTTKPTSTIKPTTTTPKPTTTTTTTTTTSTSTTTTPRSTKTTTPRAIKYTTTKQKTAAEKVSDKESNSGPTLVTVVMLVICGVIVLVVVLFTYFNRPWQRGHYIVKHSREDPDDEMESSMGAEEISSLKPVAVVGAMCQSKDDPHPIAAESDDKDKKINGEDMPYIDDDTVLSHSCDPASDNKTSSNGDMGTEAVSSDKDKKEDNERQNVVKVYMEETKEPKKEDKETNDVMDESKEENTGSDEEDKESTEDKALKDNITESKVESKMPQEEGRTSTEDIEIKKEIKECKEKRKDGKGTKNGDEESMESDQVLNNKEKEQKEVSKEKDQGKSESPAPSSDVAATDRSG